MRIGDLNKDQLQQLQAIFDMAFENFDVERYSQEVEDGIFDQYADLDDFSDENFEEKCEILEEILHNDFKFSNTREEYLKIISNSDYVDMDSIIDNNPGFKSFDMETKIAICEDWIWENGGAYYYCDGLEKVLVRFQ